ncbi:hypothetical protein ADK33_30215 [Streptomyces griseus subsp. rhodochrous]|nr:hypothetical protein ADK33_30215 [Streptomyces griseus subsp. rhodochrous]
MRAGLGQPGRQSVRSAVSLVTVETVAMAVVLRSARRRLILTAWQEPGQSRLFTMATLSRRISARPWPLPRVRPWSGMPFQGRDFSCLRFF